MKGWRYSICECEKENIRDQRLGNLGSRRSDEMDDEVSLGEMK